ncbi:ATP-binding protein [Methylobacterium planeticum]|uniref:histidine kinase n=1 Tax=Methylobacterium planeticum TaxID=2615211 RepID=A0A6N6MXA2_9HYPH|nr:ATP-binding protein [Methylobacterium planeticum]KAB1076059.1 HAMP domain-containing protein [Methylobacterium planeticum]
MSLRARVAKQVLYRSSWRGSLFRKYVLTLVSLVALVLSINAGVETWILYRQTRAQVTHAQTDYAAAAVTAVQNALAEIEREVSWVTRASAVTLAQHRDDYDLLLRQVPGVLAVAFLDGAGREQVRARRSNAAAPDPAPETGAAGGPAGFGKPYFVGTEPYAPLAIRHSGANAGMTVAQVSLQGLSGALPPGPPGLSGAAYVVDGSGRILARTPKAPEEIGAEMTRLPQVAAVVEGGGEAGMIGRDPAGGLVLASPAAIPTLPASVVVEQPLLEAMAPIRDLLFRLASLLAFGLVVAICASLVLARRLIVPIRALHAGAEHLAANRFDHRIDLKTGDEFEHLADRFNHMADQLSGSYAKLEDEIEKRTRALARSVEELKSLEAAGRAIVSSLNLDEVAAAVADRAVALTGAEAGAVYLMTDLVGTLALAGARPGPGAFPPNLTQGALALFGAAPDQNTQRIPDLAEAAWLPGPDLKAAGFGSGLVVPLADKEGPLGLVLLLRAAEGTFAEASAKVVQTFAHQAVLAIRNARLFHQVDEKGRALAVADLHKTQFFANMSHELRTPLNAVLGYSELLVDGLYGPLSDRALDALERVQINGRHLLSLINDVLDFTKIEAGSLSLSFQDYSMRAVIESVAAAAASLAQNKNLALTVAVADDLPLGQGDERRLTQVLMNLVGNAIKFTEAGTVRVEAEAEGGWYTVTVRDSGPGIALEDQARIFEEFQQIDSSSTRKQGGTGLGLSIARKLVLLHGGRIEVESELGQGAAFRVILPIRASEERQAA